MTRSNVPDSNHRFQLFKRQAAAQIDHTLLKPTATRAEILELCDQARRHEFFSVCVNPGYVPYCRERLSGSPVLVCTVVGFPLGANTTAVKAFETKRAIEDGAREIDMVIAIGALLAGDLAAVEADIAAVVAAAGSLTVKVILENCFLTREQIVDGCRCARDAGAAFVKTSTGFGGGGAKIEDVVLMKASISAAMKVKASGGIRDWATMSAMLEAGATRIGTSSGIAILNAISASGNGATE